MIKHNLAGRRAADKGPSSNSSGSTSPAVVLQCALMTIPCDRDLPLRLLGAALVAALAAAACGPKGSLPQPGSDAYREVVGAFYAGLAAMEVGADAHAEKELLRATELAPGEPAAWADLGLLALRRNELDLAGERLERAHRLAPASSRMEALLAALASQRGEPEAARTHLRRAIALDSTNVRAMFALATELEQGDSDVDLEQAAAWLERILSLSPGNTAVEVEAARLAARRGDADRLRATMERLRGASSGWPSAARGELDSATAAAVDSGFRQTTRHLTFLRNVLLSTDAFRAHLAAVQSPTERSGEPMRGFLRLATPRPVPAPADDSLRFVSEPAYSGEPARWAWTGAIDLGTDGGVSILVGDGHRVRSSAGVDLPFPGGRDARPPSRSGVLAFDFDNDFRTDLALVGAGGLRLFRQDTTGSFSDVTGRTGLPASVVGQALTSAWAFDVDLEGDLDVLASGADRSWVLRNNGDGTFDVTQPFGEVAGIRDFVWADLDGDGDPDVALVDGQERLRVFDDERQGRFEEKRLPQDPGRVLAIAAADLDRDGAIDLVLFEADGAVVRLPGDGSAGLGPSEPLVRWDGAAPGGWVGPARIAAADVDDNGALDVIASIADRTRIWLQDAAGYRPVGEPLDLRLFEVAEPASGGLPRLLGLTSAGDAAWAVGRGSKGYHWVQLRPRAAERAGDQRINSRGIGGLVELRSGPLYQEATIVGPVVHFGLGERTGANVARIIWPNGLVQAEFDLAANQTLRARQRLKGSCPWVFSYDGRGMRFVTDFLWRSPLGMRINAQQTAGVATTRDWIRIRGDQLAERDGGYDLRITAELWETHFFDQVSLRVVDHPPGTEAFVDERFAVPPPELAVRITGPLMPVAGARDDRGRDVRDVIAARDGRYLDTFGLGDYQGVTRDHYVELELGEGVPTSGPVWLIASGWVRPTDSSINVALSQGDRPRPTGLSLEVPDGRGGWRVARQGLGFPAGKSKTILIDLRDVLAPGGPHRIRLRTNLEVYWDRIVWARGLPETETRVQAVAPATAELRYRGFSFVRQNGPSSPEIPVYDELAGTAPRWRDLVGYYTRYGDVRELLGQVDDRYAIMNAGDELALRFPAPPPPPPGWRRDFVLVGDGWVKDGDYNTDFSRTVGPLPEHGRTRYAEPPDGLRGDPVYRAHAHDWEAYQTRYVGPERFRRALVPEPVRSESDSPGGKQRDR